MVIAHYALKSIVERHTKKRKVHISRKADWPRFTFLMADYQQKLYTSQCILSKTISGKKSLPLITQSFNMKAGSLAWKIQNDRIPVF